MQSPEAATTVSRNRRSLFDLVADCTIQVWVNGQFRGSGFFIGPGIVVTCAHVLADARRPEEVEVKWRDTATPGVRYWREPSVDPSVDPYPYPDIAVVDLRIDNDVWAEIDDGEPVMSPKPDSLYSVGWTTQFAADKPRLTPIRFIYEGPLADSTETRVMRLQLREGQVSRGMSGSPVLNVRTGRVCGVVSRTRDSDSAIGGWAVPIATNLAQFPVIGERTTSPINDSWNQLRLQFIFEEFKNIIRPGQRSLPPRAYLPPSILLRTEFAVVPFRGRQTEISDLISWCTSNEQAAVRLLLGPAGIGKTRLAARLCSEMSQRGWTAGYLREGSDPEYVDRLREIGSPLLLVLDYGDAWEEIRNLLVRLEAPAETAPPTRLILLARHGGDWWHRLQSAYPTLAMQEEAVGEIIGSPDDLRDAYSGALEAFERLLGSAGQGRPEPPARLRGKPILLVHMAALLAADGGAKGQANASKPITDVANAVVMEVLSREQQYWQRSVKARRLEVGDVLLQRAVTLGVLFGWEDETDLASLLASVPDLADSSAERRHELARWIKSFYPADDSSHQQILQPDLLAEHLVIKALLDCPQLLAATTRVATYRSDRALAIIDRACQESNPLRYLLANALRVDLLPLGTRILNIGDVSEGPLREELMRAIRSATTDLHTLEALRKSIPPRSILLHDVAIAIGRRSVEIAAQSGDKSLLGAYLEKLATELEAAGYVHDALELSAQSLDLIKSADHGGDDLIAESIIAQSKRMAARLQNVHRAGESVAVLQQAKEVADQVTARSPDRGYQMLASVQSSLTSAYQALGYGDEVVTSVREEWNLASNLAQVTDLQCRSSLAAYFQHRASTLDRFLSRSDVLAMLAHSHEVRLEAAQNSHEPVTAEINAWSGLANAYQGLGMKSAAVEARNSSLLGLRLLYVQDPARYSGELAAALVSMAGDKGRDQIESSALLREGVGVRRSLASQSPSPKNTLALTQALVDLSNRLERSQELEESLELTETAVDMLSGLAEDRVGPRYLDLANALDVLTGRLVRMNLYARAVVAAIERIEIYRRIAAANFGLYGPRLVVALIDSMRVFHAAGINSRVRDTGREVMSLTRRIERRAVATGADPSKALASAGIALAQAGMFDDAISFLKDSVAARREQFDAATLGESGPALIRALGYLADALSLAKRWREAVGPADEALTTSSRMLLNMPQDRSHGGRRSDTEEFYGCLVRLRWLLMVVGRREYADRIYEDGRKVLRLLASRHGNARAVELLARDVTEYRPAEALRFPKRYIH